MGKFGCDSHVFGLEYEKHAAISLEVLGMHRGEILLIQDMKQVLRYLTNMPSSLQHAPIVAKHFDQEQFARDEAD